MVHFGTRMPCQDAMTCCHAQSPPTCQHVTLSTHSTAYCPCGMQQAASSSPCCKVYSLCYLCCLQQAASRVWRRFAQGPHQQQQQHPGCIRHWWNIASCVEAVLQGGPAGSGEGLLLLLLVATARTLSRAVSNSTALSDSISDDC